MSYFLHLRQSIWRFLRGRDGVLILMPIGKSAIKWEKPDHLLLPGGEMQINIDDKYIMTLEPCHVGQSVFAIQIVSCRLAEVIEAMELDEDV